MPHTPDESPPRSRSPSIYDETLENDDDETSENDDNETSENDDIISVLV